MTFPTVLTLLRFVFSGALFYALYQPGIPFKLLAISLFLICGFTDWLDGYLARRWNQITDLGALLDPIADKFMVLGCFTVFAHLGIIPIWMVLIICVREVSVTWVRLVLAKRNVVIPAEKEGKLKMVLQLVAIAMVMIRLLLLENADGYQLAGSAVTLAMWMSLWAAVVLTLYSGVKFFVRLRA